MNSNVFHFKTVSRNQKQLQNGQNLMSFTFLFFKKNKTLTPLFPVEKREENINAASLSIY